MNVEALCQAPDPWKPGPRRDERRYKLMLVTYHLPSPPVLGEDEALFFQIDHDDMRFRFADVLDRMGDGFAPDPVASRTRSLFRARPSA
jgi:hypothetical protein